MAYDFDRKITISLRRDEAIVLSWYLGRELYRHDAERLTPSFEHAAEVHSLLALHQALLYPLLDTGGPEADAIHTAALEHLLARFT